MSATSSRVAGRRLAGFLSQRLRRPLVVAATAGGLEVGLGIADVTGWPSRFVRVLPLYPPWKSTLVYGAVAGDRSLVIDEFLIEALELDRKEIRRAIAGRMGELETMALPPLELSARESVVLVDDGVASRPELRAVIAALRNAGAGELVIAIAGCYVPTIRELAGAVDAIYHLSPERELRRFPATLAGEREEIRPTANRRAGSTAKNPSLPVERTGT